MAYSDRKFIFKFMNLKKKIIKISFKKLKNYDITLSSKTFASCFKEIPFQILNKDEASNQVLVFQLLRLSNLKQKLYFFLNNLTSCYLLADNELWTSLADSSRAKCWTNFFQFLSDKQIHFQSNDFSMIRNLQDLHKHQSRLPNIQRLCKNLLLKKVLCFCDGKRFQCQCAFKLWNFFDEINLKLNLSSFLDEIKRRVIQILSGIIFQMKKLSLLEFFFLCYKDLKFIQTSNYFNSSSFLLFVFEKGFLNYFLYCTRF